MADIGVCQTCKKELSVRLKAMRGLISWGDEREKPEPKYSSIFIFSSKHRGTAVREIF